MALVTGGGRGIGRAIALAFAGAGARVAIAGRRLEDLERTAGEIRAAGSEALAVQIDVTDDRAVRAGVGRVTDLWGPIHVLVNTAGIGGPTTIAHEDETRWRAIVETNLLGTYRVSREALRLMPEGGRIVNLSSVLGRFGVAGYTAYCASKHGVIGFTRALALEVIDRGITVNALCPGWVETEMALDGMRAGARAFRISIEEFRRRALDEVPIKRIIQPEEVAGLVLFLASPAAAAITGQTYNICGGQAMA